MLSRTHTYDVRVEWTGNLGSGTDGYRSFSRNHEVRVEGKPGIAGSADAVFRGDAGRWNPEELLVASVAQCHMMSYFHLCAGAGVTVVGYRDAARGVLRLDGRGGGGEITEVVLRPEVVVAEASMVEEARALHGRVGAVCFIARSVSFPIRHEPVVRVQGG